MVRPPTQFIIISKVLPLHSHDMVLGMDLFESFPQWRYIGVRSGCPFHMGLQKGMAMIITDLEIHFLCNIKFLRWRLVTYIIKFETNKIMMI